MEGLFPSVVLQEMKSWFALTYNSGYAQRLFDRFASILLSARARMDRRAYLRVIRNACHLILYAHWSASPVCLFANLCVRYGSARKENRPVKRWYRRGHERHYPPEPRGGSEVHVVAISDLSYTIDARLFRQFRCCRCVKRSGRA